MLTSSMKWDLPNNCSSVISLTYDKATQTDLKIIIPSLNQNHLKATFFIYPPAMIDNILDWQLVERNGHELGNGALLGAASLDGSLPLWNLEMIDSDLQNADDLLNEISGKKLTRSFAYPNGDPRCHHDLNYQNLINERYKIVRSGLEGVNTLKTLDTKYMCSINANKMSLKHLITFIDHHQHTQCWIILKFDTSEEANFPLNIEEHFKLIDWLSEQKSKFWTTSLNSMSEYLISSQKELITAA